MSLDRWQYVMFCVTRPSFMDLLNLGDLGDEITKTVACSSMQARSVMRDKSLKCPTVMLRTRQLGLGVWEAWYKRQPVSTGDQA